MAQKAIFLDRDDTVIDDPGYINQPEQIKLLPGAAEAMIQFKKMGYRVIILTNQSAIARGLLTEEKLADIHKRLKSLLAAEGAFIDRIYYCPYHPEGTVKGFDQESPLRKPSPGMFHLAAKELDIDLSRSWMIGDRYRDIEAGKAAGCHTILVDVPGKIRDQKPTDPQPDRKAVNLREAVNIIRMFEFHQKAQAAKTEDRSQTANREQRTEDREQGLGIGTGNVASIGIGIGEENTTPTPKSEQATLPIPKPIPSEDVHPASETPADVDRPAPAQELIAEPQPIKLHTAKPIPKADVPPPEEPADHAEKTHRLLQEILQRLAATSRNEFTDDFSIHKLLAWMAQVLALGCFVFSLWFWLSPEVGLERVQLMLGYAIALQLLVISLLLMHRRE